MPVRCGRGSTVAVEHATAMQARRVGSRIDAGTTTIREEGESGNFFYIISVRIAMLSIEPFGYMSRLTNAR
jgi:hypothetical protein